MSDNELKRPDSYDFSNYKRIKAKLFSGSSAWIYVNTITEVV